MDLRPIFEPKTMAVFGVSASNYHHSANEQLLAIDPACHIVRRLEE